jgi:hypothetical protein
MTSALSGTRRRRTVSAAQTPAPRGRGNEGRQHRSATTEHVVYRYDPRCAPAITYHSIQHGCTGGSNTLAEARDFYRRDMAELLNVRRQELPPTVEHLEAVVVDMWVRAKVLAVHRDPSNDQMFLQTLLSEGPAQQALHARLARKTNDGDEPVVVIVEPHDTVGDVLDQTAADDTLFIVHFDPDDVLGWIVIHGPEADGGFEAPCIANHAGLRRMPIGVLTQTYAAGSREVRLTLNHLRDVNSSSATLVGRATPT